MQNQITQLIEDIKASYAGFGPLTDVRKEMIEEFNDNITYTVGKKYIKICHRAGCVWGFVVNTDTDKKFLKGDILKAAGWASPARNSARGNIITGDYSICWTGPHYLK